MSNEEQGFFNTELECLKKNNPKKYSEMKIQVDSILEAKQKMEEIGFKLTFGLEYNIEILNVV